MRSETTANTKPGKQLDQKSNRLKQATAKAYYRFRRDYTSEGIAQLILNCSNFKPRSWGTEVKSWQGAEQLADLQKD